MNNIKSVNSKRMALHVAAVLILLAGMLLILSAHTFAAASPAATAQVNSASGANLRKSSTMHSGKVVTLADNTRLTIYRAVYKSKTSTSKRKIWYYVKASNGKKGYIRADLVDHVKYRMVSGTVRKTAAFRKGPGIKMKRKGTIKKGTPVTIYLDARPVASTRGSNKVWYKIYYKGSWSFICSTNIKVGSAVNTSSGSEPTQDQVNNVLNITSNAMSRMTAAQFENYLKNQGFPESYKKSLRALHAKHPNWIFVAYKTGLNWMDVMKKETKYGVSLVHSSYPKSYRSTSKNSFSSYKLSAGIEEEPVLAEETAVPDDSSETAKAEETNEAEGTADSAVIPANSDSASSFDDVKAALESQNDGTAETVTGTVVPETISVMIEADSGSTVLAELSKDAKVTIKAASVTTEHPAEAQSEEQVTSKWYEVEFEKSSASAAADDDSDTASDDDTDAETANALPAYVSEDQDEDKELEAANDAAADEIIGNDQDDPESTSETDDADADEEGAEAESSDEVKTALDADSNILKGYVRAEDIEVVLAGTQNEAKQEEPAAEATSEETETTSETASEEAETTSETAPAETESTDEAEAAAVTEQNEEEAVQIYVDDQAESSSAMNAYYQVEPGWYNANANVVAYYMDPRNFLNEDRIFMFENLAYQSEYQTASVVNKIFSGTKLPSYGFTANVFMSAGKKYNISPVFLAARVVQETGGNSVSVNGSKSGGVRVYNPFNIGAYGSNPAAQGLAYAKKMGWTTPAKAVNGGASYLASGYINKKQNTIYFQRFNVANGLANAGTHQYMTNVMAPYSEAHITKSSYAKLGITNEPLGFVIPIYNNMPSKTKLP